MPFFSHKKSRSSRAAELRASSTRSGRLHHRLQDRNILLRLSLCLLTIVGMLFAVQAWKPPFPYRLGDHSRHGIVAGSQFQRMNRFKTEQAKAEAEERVPYVFRHNPQPLSGAPARLRSRLEEVAAVDSIARLSAETRTAFGMSSAESIAAAADLAIVEPDELFLMLKVSVTGEGTVERRIDQIVADFEMFIAPLADAGIVAGDDLNSNDIRGSDAIQVVDRDGQPLHPPAPAANYRISHYLRESEILGGAWAAYPTLSPIRPVLERWLLTQIPPTLRYDARATEEARRDARNRIAPIPDIYEEGVRLVAPGQMIDEEVLALLQAEYEQTQTGFSQDAFIRVGTVFLMFLVLAVLNGHYLVYNEPQLVRSIGRLSTYLAVIVLAVAFGRILSFDPWRAEIIPLMAAVMVFAIAYNQVLAILTAFTLSLILTVSTVGDLGRFVVLMSVSAAAVIPLSRVSSRSTLVKVGFWSAAVYFVVTWGTGIIQSRTMGEVWGDSALLIESLRGAGWCLATGYLVAGSLPFIESAFGVVTNISLLEMSDVSHPLLQELIRRAPGTYNHSISMATIGEAAADRIGANGLLVRVGAYFHDIGKMLKPDYFIENMTAETGSRHDHLAPAMSTLIIIGHVKDGVDLAEQHNLPRPIIDFIEQHHGTTLVEFFWHEATRLADLDPDHRTDAEESSFRYPGPKPQTREAGVMMLADAVESASRTLSDPTPKRIESLVRTIGMKRLLDGQFDESTLTLTEIRLIEDSLIKSLIGIYHGRIKYPEQQTA
jgi:cyclic-di-AMP phosphodiesterase PgpH